MLDKVKELIGDVKAFNASIKSWYMFKTAAIIEPLTPGRILPIPTKLPLMIFIK